MKGIIEEDEKRVHVYTTEASFRAPIVGVRIYRDNRSKYRDYKMGHPYTKCVLARGTDHNVQLVNNGESALITN